MHKGYDVSTVWVTYHSSGSDNLPESQGRMQIRQHHALCSKPCISKQWYSYLDILCKLH